MEVEALFNAQKAQLSKYTDEGLKAESERLKKDLERKHRLASALNEGNPESLTKEIHDLRARMREMREEWESYKAPLLANAKSKKGKLDRVREQYADKIEEIKMMKEDIKEMIEEADYKEELHDLLLEEEAKGTSSVNRHLYINKIGDIVTRLKGQKKELSKNIKDITQLQVSVELTKDALSRVEQSSESLMNTEATKNKKARPI